MSTTAPDKPKKHPSYPVEPWSQTIKGLFKRIVKLVAWGVGITVAVVLVLVVYQAMDEDGYISHDRTLDVWMTSNWLGGENRVCFLSLQYDANGKPTGQLDTLQCPLGDQKMEAHNISVSFKGIVSPTDMDGNPRRVADQWKCTRESSSLLDSGGFTCVPMAYPVKPTTPQ
jgi:hypothetical protein